MGCTANATVRLELLDEKIGAIREHAFGKAVDGHGKAKLGYLRSSGRCSTARSTSPRQTG